MSDRISDKRRSWNMSRIRSSDTKPEIIVRSLLHRMGFRFRLHRKDLYGRPDIVMHRYRTVIFVNGCFWHQHTGCVEASSPKSNTTYWNAKLKANMKRDRRNHRLLIQQGWRVLGFWECEIEKDPLSIALRISRELRNTSQVSDSHNLPSRKDLLKAAESNAGYNRLN